MLVKEPSLGNARSRGVKSYDFVKVGRNHTLIATHYQYKT